VHAYLREMARVLAPSGRLLVISLREPAVQVPLLEGIRARSGSCCSGSTALTRVQGGADAGSGGAGGQVQAAAEVACAEGEGRAQQQQGGLLRVQEVVQVEVSGRNMQAHVYVCCRA
jgi:hypothetical protein